MKQRVSRQFKFSHAGIEDLPTPSKGGQEYSDFQAEGLRIYVGRNGRKVWRYRYWYEGKKGTIVLGKFPGMSLKEARELAQAKERMIREGVNPKTEIIKRRECPTLRQFVEEVFLPYAEHEYKSIRDIRSRVAGKILPVLGDLKLVHIRREDIARMVDTLAREHKTGTTANRTRYLLSAIMEKAIDYGYIETNPSRRIRRCKENGPRVVFMKDEELARFHQVLMKRVEERDINAEAIAILMLTGMRSLEGRSLAWDQIDMENGEIYIFADKAKTLIARSIPLNSMAIDLLKRIFNERGAKSPFVFPSRSKTGHIIEIRKTLAALIEQANVRRLTPHDLRRQFATTLRNQGQKLDTISSLLGHSSVKVTEKIYAHLINSTLRPITESFVDKLNDLKAA